MRTDREGDGMKNGRKESSIGDFHSIQTETLLLARGDKQGKAKGGHTHVELHGKISKKEEEETCIHYLI